MSSRKLTRRGAPDKRGSYDAFFLCEDDFEAATCEWLFVFDLLAVAFDLLADALDFVCAVARAWCAFRRALP